jgi:hypothetical protein
MASKTCPVGPTGQMAKLHQIEHEDRSVAPAGAVRVALTFG